MCRKIFIGATGQHFGKTIISLSLIHLARRKYQRVGFIKPIGPKRIQYQGLIIAGHAPISSITQRILEDSNIPSIRVHQTTSEVYYRLREHVSKIGPDDTEKIELINSIAEKYISFDAIDSMLG